MWKSKRNCKDSMILSLFKSEYICRLANSCMPAKKSTWEAFPENKGKRDEREHEKHKGQRTGI